MTRSTEQEEFWAGEFGDSYTTRNEGLHWVASNTAFFSKVLSCTGSIKNAIEFGSNIGLNLQAIKTLLPNANLSAIEINKKAATILRNRLPDVTVFETSILDFKTQNSWDFVFSKGVLIHINPEMLPRVYDAMYTSTRRFLMIAEYFNPSPIEVPYRGHSGKLFKRDFAGEILDRYNDLRLLDYGFSYHRDPNFPQDNLNWFLLERQKPAI